MNREYRRNMLKALNAGTLTERDIQEQAVKYLHYI